MPDIFLHYSFSTDFDYRKYLEEKSHFDRVSIAVNDLTDRLLGNSEVIARTLGAGLSSINNNLVGIDSTLQSIDNEIRNQTGVLVEGFSLMSAGLSEISSGIDNLRAVTEFGFAELLSSSRFTNSLIAELVTVVSTPEQTWAKEQFDLAKECASNELWPEALEYVEKAINGIDGKAGLKIEPTFYYFRGTIFLGNYDGGVELLNLNSAFDDFQLCSRYCAKKRDHLKGEALAQAGWCKYLKGEVVESIKYYKAALEATSDSPEAKYLLAKSYLHLRDEEKAEPLFKDAIRGSALFVSRAFLDADFLRHIEKVEHWAEDVRFARQTELRKTADNHLRPRLQKRLSGLSGLSGITFEIRERVYSIGETLKKDQGLLVLDKLEHEIFNDLSDMPQKYNKQLKLLEEHAFRLKAREPKTKPVTDSLSSRVEKKGVSIFETGGVFLNIGLFGGAITAIYAAVVTCQNDNCGPVGWTLLFPLYSLMSAIVAVPIGGAIGFGVGFLIGSIKKLNAYKEAEYELIRDKNETKDLLNVELRQIEADKLLAAKIEKQVREIRDDFPLNTIAS